MAAALNLPMGVAPCPQQGAATLYPAQRDCIPLHSCPKKLTAQNIAGQLFRLLKKAPQSLSSKRKTDAGIFFTKIHAPARSNYLQIMCCLRQYRTITGGGMCRKIFCQMKQKAQGILGGFTSIFVKYGGKFWCRPLSEPIGVNCAVLP